MSEVIYINLNQIHSNPYQPRNTFDEESLNELAKSIHENGMIQPIVVRQKDDSNYEIIAGERRCKACQQLKWEAVPCIIMNADEQQMAQLALIENIQRENLSPIEEANAYKQILRMSDITQETLAKKVGKTQSSVANKIRLLNLSDKTQQAINDKTITERHGRAMLHLTPKQQASVLKAIKKKNLTVTDTEKYIEKHYSYKPLRKDSIKVLGINTRIAINSIKQAYRSLKKVDVPVTMVESETDELYTITINIKK